MNHSRDRLDGESPKQYRERRAASDAILADAIALRQHDIDALERARLRMRNAKRRLLRARKAEAVSLSQRLKSSGKVRKHKQKHHAKDAQGFAMSWTGRERRVMDLPGGTASFPERRVWLAGISAQRGY